MSNCIDCGIATKDGAGSARCSDCWNSRLGDPTPTSREAEEKLAEAWCHSEGIFGSLCRSYAHRGFVAGLREGKRLERAEWNRVAMEGIGAYSGDTNDRQEDAE